MARLAWLKMRVGEREKDLFRECASGEGLGMSEWLRRLALVRVAEMGLIRAERSEKDAGA